MATVRELLNENYIDVEKEIYARDKGSIKIRSDVGDSHFIITLEDTREGQIFMEFDEVIDLANDLLDFVKVMQKKV